MNEKGTPWSRGGQDAAVSAELSAVSAELSRRLSKAEELFDKFVQRSGDRTGMGLGLAITLRAVEASGGRLTVRDLPGEGCEFTVDVPAAERVETQPHQ